MFPLIQIGSFKMGTFPLCTGLGIAAIASLIYYQTRCFKFDNNSESKFMIAIPFSLLTGCVTGYLSDVIFRGGFKALLHPIGYGVTFYGWLIGCILFYLFYAKIAKLNRLLILNAFLPAFLLAQAFGRIGCFLGGCCFGKPVSWGVSYPEGSYPFSVYGSQPLIPVQLFESAWLLIAFLIVFRCIRFKYRAAWYLIMVSTGRFFLEFLRGDNRGTVGLDFLSPAQAISIFLFLCGTVLFTRQILLKKHVPVKSKKTPAHL